MVGYIFSRILQVVPLLIALSIVSFLIIELPPGDYLTSLILRLEQSGKQLNDEEVLRLKKQYGLDRPAVVRYSCGYGGSSVTVTSAGRLPGKDRGRSHHRAHRPDHGHIDSHPAVHLGGSCPGRYLFGGTTILSVRLRYHVLRLSRVVDPQFLLALILMWLAFNYLDVAVTGLFSRNMPILPGAWRRSEICSATSGFRFWSLARPVRQASFG